jgi:hypothetical protein
VCPTGCERQRENSGDKHVCCSHSREGGSWAVAENSIHCVGCYRLGNDRPCIGNTSHRCQLLKGAPTTKSTTDHGPKSWTKRQERPAKPKTTAQCCVIFLCCRFALSNHVCEGLLGWVHRSVLRARSLHSSTASPCVHISHSLDLPDTASLPLLSHTVRASMGCALCVNVCQTRLRVTLPFTFLETHTDCLSLWHACTHTRTSTAHCIAPCSFFHLATSLLCLRAHPPVSSCQRDGGCVTHVSVVAQNSIIPSHRLPPSATLVAVLARPSQLNTASASQPLLDNQSAHQR